MADIERRSFLNKPPEVVLRALANLQSQHELEPSRVPEFLDEMFQRYPKLAQSNQGYTHQGFGNDRLFKPTYEHVQEPTAANAIPPRKSHGKIGIQLHLRFTMALLPLGTPS